MLKKILAEKAGLYILDKVKNTKVRTYLNLYYNSLSWSKDEVENFQVGKTQQLLEYAYNNTAFYKKRFNEAGFNYKKFRYLDQLKEIPPLRRKDLQENLDNIISKEMDLTKCMRGSSSGSTGTPIIYYQDFNALSAGKAAVIFCKMLGGYKLGDKWLNIWGNPTAVNVEWKKLSSKISKFMFNEIRYPAYRLTSDNEFRLLTDYLIKNKPVFIYGYTNAIYLLSEYLKKNSIEVNFVKGVFTTAENLHEYQRKNIEGYLGKIYDQYGSSEINGVACETLHREGYLILAPNVYVEFGDIVDLENGSRKLIITNFYNKILPFIRYENGDLAVPSEDKNENKIKFPGLKSVQGRVSDIIKLADGGSLVVPSFFGSRMLKNINGIIQYQVIRKKADSIEVNLITSNEFKEEYKEIILETLQEYIPGELHYELVFNHPTIISKNNKFKLFVDLTSQ